MSTTFSHEEARVLLGLENTEEKRTIDFDVDNLTKWELITPKNGDPKELILKKRLGDTWSTIGTILIDTVLEALVEEETFFKALKTKDLSYFMSLSHAYLPTTDDRFLYMMNKETGEVFLVNGIKSGDVDKLILEELGFRDYKHYNEEVLKRVGF